MEKRRTRRDQSPLDAEITATMALDIQNQRLATSRFISSKWSSRQRIHLLDEAASLVEGRSMIQTLRDAACDCQEEGIRFELNLSAAALEYAIKRFCADPTDELLKEI